MGLRGGGHVDSARLLVFSLPCKCFRQLALPRAARALQESWNSSSVLPLEPRRWSTGNGFTGVVELLATRVAAEVAHDHYVQSSIYRRADNLIDMACSLT